MRRLGLLLVAVCAVAAIVTSASTAGEKAWFDLENCAMCKNLTQDPDLLMNLTWEQHNIKHGIVSVTTVDKAHLDSYRAANEAMDKVAERLAKGEQLELCGGCTAFGAIMMSGQVAYETVPTSHGDVTIFTSENPEIVKKLQDWAARNTEEMTKYEAHEHQEG